MKIYSVKGGIAAVWWLSFLKIGPQDRKILVLHLPCTIFIPSTPFPQTHIQPNTSWILLCKMERLFLPVANCWPNDVVSDICRTFLLELHRFDARYCSLHFASSTALKGRKSSKKCALWGRKRVRRCHFYKVTFAGKIILQCCFKASYISLKAKKKCVQ